MVIEKETRELIAVSSNSRVEEHLGGGLHTRHFDVSLIRFEGHFVPIRSSWRKFLAEYIRNPSAEIASPSMGFASAPATIMSRGL